MWNNARRPCADGLFLQSGGAADVVSRFWERADRQDAGGPADGFSPTAPGLLAGPASFRSFRRSCWRPMLRPPRYFVSLYWAASVASAIVALLMAAFYAPVDPSMGLVQKIVYLHLPAVINMFIGSAVVFGASVGYLWQRRPRWDAIAGAATEMTAVLASLVLITGVIWARSAWGVWWTWSPRLTFSLVLWVIYVALLALRRVIRPEGRMAMISAAYAVVAFANVPLFYLSIIMLPDMHPADSRLLPAMRLTVLACLAPATMLCAGFTFLRRKSWGAGAGATT